MRCTRTVSYATKELEVGREFLGGEYKYIRTAKHQVCWIPIPMHYPSEAPLHNAGHDAGVSWDSWLSRRQAQTLHATTPIESNPWL